MDRFTEAVQVGTSGSTTESGVLAALVAAAGDRECNAGFRRQGASLEFVFVSDEEDQSPLSLETAVRWLSMLDARVHAVVGSNDRDLGEGRRGCIHPDPEPQRPFSGFSQGERTVLTTAALGQRYAPSPPSLEASPRRFAPKILRSLWLRLLWKVPVRGSDMGSLWSPTRRR